jgi:hypothetical protein
MSTVVVNRSVVLLKSLRTNNRFYALVTSDSGYKNADAIDEFPPGLMLGIAYPCLEDGLNDFAVIRTTFETIALFADDEELRREMMTIIEDARSNLVRRLEELRDRIVRGQAHFMGTDLREFQSHILHMVHRGTIRRQLDSMMKVDVFESVSKAEAAFTGGAPEPMYRYEFLPQYDVRTLESLPPRAFIGRLFDDVLDSVTTGENYGSKYQFDRNVFQKFIAVMFVNYATTDSMFYGIHKDDYAVSQDKDMQDTPLYRAIARAVIDLERGLEFSREGSVPATSQSAPAGEQDDLTALFGPPEDDFLKSLQEAGHGIEVPFGTEGQMLEHFAYFADAMRLLKMMDHPHAADVRQIIGNAGQRLFRTLQELGIISPLAQDPFSDDRQD